jgi:hypothetical protein
MVFISLIIFNYKRVKFIKHAIENTINFRDIIDMEIIVLKSYQNSEIEEFLDSYNIKYINLYTNNLQSDYIKMAARESAGEVLIFLDDDDLFSGEKFRIVYDLFKSRPELGYYHNNFSTIDENGNFVKNQNYKKRNKILLF